MAIKGLIALALLATFLFQAANMGIYAYAIGIGKHAMLDTGFIGNALGVAAWVAIIGSVLVILLSTRFGRLWPVGIAIGPDGLFDLVAAFQRRQGRWLGNVRLLVVERALGNRLGISLFRIFLVCVPNSTPPARWLRWADSRRRWGWPRARPLQRCS